jgi:hypothetical protein
MPLEPALDQTCFSTAKDDMLPSNMEVVIIITQCFFCILEQPLL